MRLLLGLDLLLLDLLLLLLALPLLLLRIGLCALLWLWRRVRLGEPKKLGLRLRRGQKQAGQQGGTEIRYRGHGGPILARAPKPKLRLAALKQLRLICETRPPL
jgi:hypothetical protein